MASQGSEIIIEQVSIISDKSPDLKLDDKASRPTSTVAGNKR